MYIKNKFLHEHHSAQACFTVIVAIEENNGNYVKALL